MDIDAERAQHMFQAVVAQALIDAVSEPSAVGPINLNVNPRKGESPFAWIARLRATHARRMAAAIENERRDRMEAREWLTRDRDNFPMVVSLAGYNPDDIRARALKLEAAGWVPPEKIAA